MKKRLIYIGIAFLMLFCLVACGEKENPDDKKDKLDEKPITLSVDLNDEITMTAGDKKSFDYSIENNEEELEVEISSSDEAIVKINNKVIEALKQGSVIVKLTIKDKNISKEIKVNVVNPSFDITFNGDYDYDLNENTTYTLTYEASDKKCVVASLGYEFSSSNEAVATINEKGEIKTLAEGKSTITVMSKWDNSYKYTIEINVTFDPLAVIESYNIDQAMYQNVKTFGSTEINQMVKGSVNYYTPMDLNLVEKIIPITDNSPYAGMTATEELLTEAEGKNKYMRSGILHTETTKITYHDTGNNSNGATALMHANYLVSSGNQSSRARSWHYTVDDSEVIHHVPDNEVTWQGDNYYAYSTSIGIETCVDQGSELDITWHRTAKLMASLINKYNMKITDVVQHNTWSGKNCPQTLRMNNLYEYAIKMIEAELAVLTTLNGYTITFTSLNPELVDDNGHVIAIPETATEIAYVVTATNDNGYNKSRVLYSTIPGSDGSKKDTNNNTNIHKFYDSFNNLTINNYQDSLTIYESLSNEDKARAVGLTYLLDTVKKLNGGTTPKLSIEEVYFGNKMRYQFIQIKNNTTSKQGMNNYSIVYTNKNGESKKFELAQKTIDAGSYYLINCAINESVDPDEVIYPDFALDIDLSELGKLAIYKGETLIDEIEFNKSVIRVGYSKDMSKDLGEALINPKNSKGENYQELDNVTNDIIDFETKALAINLPLTKDQSEKIAAALALYNAMDSIEKSKTRSSAYIKSLKTKCDALK